MKYLFSFYFNSCKNNRKGVKQSVIKANAENVRHTFEDRHSPFSHFFATSQSVYLVSAGNSLFFVMFKVLQAPLVITVDSLFKKSPEREVSWRKIWGSWWPKSTADNTINEVVQKSCCFRNTCGLRTLLKPTVLLLLFRQNNEFGQKNLDSFPQ